MYEMDKSGKNWCGKKVEHKIRRVQKSMIKIRKELEVEKEKSKKIYGEKEKAEEELKKLHGSKNWDDEEKEVKAPIK